MQRIQTADGRFLAGNPQTGTPGTVVTSKFMNDMQDEICNVIEAAGFALDGEKQNQLHEAIAKLVSDATPNDASELELGLVRIATINEAKAFSDDAKAVTPLKLGNVLSELSFGMGQAWQNVTANRNFNTTYTNSTGRTIMIVHSVGDDSSQYANNNLSYLVDSVTVARYDLQVDSGQIGGVVVTFVVPHGSTYRINATKTSVLNGLQWAELR